jgi:amidase
MNMSRRDVLGTVAGAAVATALVACRRVQTPARHEGGEVLDTSAVAMAAAIRRGSISSEELVKACLDRIEKVNPNLNAVVRLREAAALAEARKADEDLRRRPDRVGVLHGVPMTIKDSFDTAGVISTGGTRGRASFVPKVDATIVARLKGAGAILLGKTNTPEFTLYAQTENLVYGRTNNPYDASRTCGGSSGGAAAIVAAGGSPFDIGSDTGGSIRFPSHLCGVAALKPTSGRVPRTGHIIPYGLGPTDAFTHVGPIARYVEDLALLFPVIAGSDWRDPAIVDMPHGDPNSVGLNQLRVAFYTDNGVAPAPTAATIAAVEAVAKILTSAGATVEAVRPPRVEGIEPYIAVMTGDGGEWVRRLVALAGTTEMSPPIIAWTTGLKPMSAVKDFTAAASAVDSYRSDVLSFMEKHDVILCPVDANPAFLHDAIPDNVFSYLIPYNISGQPAAIVRAGTSPEGLPIGVQIIARHWREDVALAVAQHVETTIGGWKRPT